MKNQRIHVPHLAAMFPVMIAIAAAAAPAQEAPIVAERPGHFTVPTLARPGDIIIESGVSLESSEFVAARSRYIISTVRYPSTTLRIGALPRLELRMSGEYVHERTTITQSGLGPQVRQGLNSIGLGAKVAISEENGAAPETGLILGLGLPLGSANFIPQSVSPSFSVGMKNSLSDALGLYYSLGTSWSGAGPAPVGSYAIALANTFTPELSGFIELYGSAASGTTPAHAFDAGVAVLVTPGLQFDVFGGRGISRSAPRYVVSLGIALRIPGQDL